MLPPVPKRPDLNQFQVLQVLTDHCCSETGYLSFSAGDILIVTEKRGNVWKCKCSNSEGLVSTEVIEEKCLAMDNPMHEASRRGNLPLLKALVSSGLSVNTLDHAGNVPLYLASRSGHVSCVKILLAANPILDKQNKLGDTVLHGASRGGHDKILELLLQQPGIEEIINLRNIEGYTALQISKDDTCGAILQKATPIEAVQEEEDSD